MKTEQGMWKLWRLNLCGSRGGGVIFAVCFLHGDMTYCPGNRLFANMGGYQAQSTDCRSARASLLTGLLCLRSSCPPLLSRFYQIIVHKGRNMDTLWNGDHVAKEPKPSWAVKCETWGSLASELSAFRAVYNSHVNMPWFISSLFYVYIQSAISGFYAWILCEELCRCWEDTITLPNSQPLLLVARRKFS